MRRALVLAGALMTVAAASVVGAMTALADPVAGPRPVNLPPQVTLTSPADGSVDVLGCPVTFAATAADPDGIDRVEFYLNGELLATDDTAPYEVTVDRGPFLPRDAGANKAFARAFDDDTPQLSADSAAVSFVMVDPPPGLPGEPLPCLQATPPTP